MNLTVDWDLLPMVTIAIAFVPVFMTFFSRCELTNSIVHVCPGCWVPRFMVALMTAAALGVYAASVGP